MTEPLVYSRYRNQLENLLAADYRFRSFPDFLANGEQSQPTILLRHDIDFDIAKVRNLADIESEMGIASTFFFMIRTLHYNVFSPEGSHDIEHILSQGHNLALHFDCAAYSAEFAANEIGKAVNNEADLLANWFGKPVDIVSYHRPSPIVMTGDPQLSTPRPHTYQKVFTDSIVYLSDSRGQWRHGFPDTTEWFTARKSMQLLMHPIWWSDEPTSPQQSLEKYLMQTSEILSESTARNCTIFQQNRRE